MSMGLIGIQRGMTRIFTEEGVSVPVSVIEVDVHRVTQIKTVESDGYPAVQITTGQGRSNRINKPRAGQFAKANVDAGRGLWEFRLNEKEIADIEMGKTWTVELFAEGQFVDVTGTSKGKGFSGVIKRHNFSSQRASHGNSLAHNAPGSIGQNQTPGRVFKGKKMAGQMGSVRKTMQNLEVVRVDKERNLLLIKGAIPGAPGTEVMIRPAVKRKNQAAAGAA